MSLGLTVVAASSFAVALQLDGGMTGQQVVPPRAVTTADSIYRITPLAVPGALFTVASDITDAGVVVGFFGPDSSTTIGFIHDGRGFTTVQYPGAARTRIMSMAADGTIAGSYQERGALMFAWRAYVRRPSGEFVSVHHEGHPHAMAQRVLDDGTVVGCFHSTDMTTTMRGTLFKDGRVSPSDIVGSMHNGASQDGRRVVGTVAGDTRSYLLEGGRVTYLERPGASRTEAWDINDAGTIVGGAIDSTRQSRAFVLDRGRWATLDVPGSISSVAFGVNRRGDVVGAWRDATGRRAFVARREPR